MSSWIVRAALLALALLVTLALSNDVIRRDAAPPELYVEVAERSPATLPFDLHLSANEPVTYRVEYGDLDIEQVAQDLKVSLLTLPGDVEISIAATDAAGNETTLIRSVHGIPLVEPRLEVPSRVDAGAPLTAVAHWREGEAAVEDSTLTVEPAAAGVAVREKGRITLLAAVPLSSADSLWPIEVRLHDEFGRETTARAEVRVHAGRGPVEELNVAASTLSVITPAGREAERRAFEHAFAETRPQPQWQEPFLLPIEGRSTSGFGFPRRYAPGGPVSYHEGSDIGAPVGTPILATNGGVVRVAEFFPIKGGLTIIDHGVGVSSLYFHQSRIHTVAGEFVERGEVIGEVGSTGLSTGPHLHWEMRINGVPSDPMAWVDRVMP